MLWNFAQDERLTTYQLLTRTLVSLVRISLKIQREFTRNAKTNPSLAVSAKLLSALVTAGKALGK